MGRAKVKNVRQGLSRFIKIYKYKKDVKFARIEKKRKLKREIKKVIIIWINLAWKKKSFEKEDKT